MGNNMSIEILQSSGSEFLLRRSKPIFSSFTAGFAAQHRMNYCQFALYYADGDVFVN